MRISIPAVFLTLALTAAVGAIDSEAASKHTLNTRGHGDRYRKSQHAVAKPDDKPIKPNGCGTGIFAGNLPFEKHFHECCNSHDRCYGKHVLGTLYSNLDRKTAELTYGFHSR